jgi:ATP phosphoribosyltransferase
MLRDSGNAGRELRLALPSKGRMEEETMRFLNDAGLSVHKPNPRQYVGSLDGFPELMVWFQRSADIVRKVSYGDVDLGITGLDSFLEHNNGSDAALIIHDELGYGKCRLAIAIPENWTEVQSVDDLLSAYRRAAREGRRMRFATKYASLSTAFLKQHGIERPLLIPAEGALEAAPQMGFADAIIDLVSSGTTLREIEGGSLVHSQAVLIGNRQALRANPELLDVTRRLLELLEAHLRGQQHHMLIANMRGATPEEVARKVFSQPDLGGLQGPTISPVYLRQEEETHWFAITLVVRKDRLERVIRQLREIGGSGVVVYPATYIFEEEPFRWKKLLQALGITENHLQER